MHDLFLLPIFFALLFGALGSGIGCSHSTAGRATSIDVSTKTASPARDSLATGYSLHIDVGSAADCAPDNTPQVQLTSGEQATDEAAIQQVDFGTVRQGTPIQRTLIVENRSSEPVAVERFESSCECLGLTGLPTVVQPGGRRRIESIIDLQKEAGFIGNLGIVVRLCAGARRVAEFRLCVVVKDQAETSAH